MELRLVIDGEQREVIFEKWKIIANLPSRPAEDTEEYLRYGKLRRLLHSYRQEVWGVVFAKDDVEKDEIVRILENEGIDYTLELIEPTLDEKLKAEKILHVVQNASEIKEYVEKGVIPERLKKLKDMLDVLERLIR